ncbi:MAG: hypothetical protein ACYS5V_14940 [Planctomycetota bacterium]|jgi:hypothetical protein
MARRKRILIGCPQYRVLVTGTYACDGQGRYLLAEDGTFALHHAQCDHYGGRCMQTLCVLHRYNKRGPGSWYPERVLAAPEAECPACPASEAPKRPAGDGLDLLA